MQGLVACAPAEEDRQLNYRWAQSMHEVLATRLWRSGVGGVFRLDVLQGDSSDGPRIVLHVFEHEPSPRMTLDLGTCTPLDIAAAGDRIAVLFPLDHGCSGTLPNTSFSLSAAGESAVVVYDRSGSFVWGRPLRPTVGRIRPSRVGIDAAGNVSLWGFGEGEVVLDGVASAPQRQDTHMLLVRLQPDGELQQLKTFDAFLNSDGAFAVDPQSGDYFVAGTFSQEADLGTGPLSASSGLAVALARLDPSGEPIWLRHFIGQASFDARFVPGGGIVLKGVGFGPSGFALGGAQVIGGAFVSRFAPDGRLEALAQLESPSQSAVYGTYAPFEQVALTASDEVVALRFTMREAEPKNPEDEPDYGRNYNYRLKLGLVDEAGRLPKPSVLSDWDSIDDPHDPRVYAQMQVIADEHGGAFVLACGVQQLNFGGQPLLAQDDTEPVICGFARLDVE